MISSSDDGRYFSTLRQRRPTHHGSRSAPRPPSSASVRRPLPLVSIQCVERGQEVERRRGVRRGLAARGMDDGAAAQPTELALVHALERASGT